MKYLIILVILSCVMDFSQCESDDAFMEWLKEVIGDCAYKEHASNLDMDEVLASKEASTYEGKCFRSCIGETTGILKNNKLDVDFAISAAQQAFSGQNEKIQTIRDILNSCADITDADRCEASSKIFHCAGISSEARGYRQASLL